MTEVEIVEGKKNITQHWMVKAKGHASFAPHGQDIICAAVSALLGSLRLTLDAWEARGDILDYECISCEGEMTIVFWSKTDAIVPVMEYLDIGIGTLAMDHPRNVSFHHRKKEF